MATYKRVNELQPKDEFMFQGVWFRVVRKDEKSIYYVPKDMKYSINGKHTLGAKSQQFVEVVR